MSLSAVASNHSSQSYAASPSHYRSVLDTANQDDIELASLARMPEILPQVIEEPTLIANKDASPKNRGLLSTWRTHLNISFPFLQSIKTASRVNQSMSPTTSQHTKTMLQGKYNSRKSSLANASIPPPSTISTNIWSDPSIESPSGEQETSQKKTTQIHIYASKSSVFSNVLTKNDDLLDLPSPKLGSRAYRERERREMERDGKENEERSLGSTTADNRDTSGVGDAK